MQQGAATRTSQASISAALAVATANAAARVPPEQGCDSVADMAQRDLDVALQLLADRAQYITGSSGAAIALRRSGRNDMLCRASAGSNAPELGALLSTEFGLSGESVRTRQLLRCDDIERDGRVNREACRQLGIASVAVMPVVNDDEVLGVFELFSGKVNAFGERDLTALKRLSEMVETAVKLSRAAEQLPDELLWQSSGSSTTEKAAGATPAAEVANPILGVGAEFVADAVLPQELSVISSHETEILLDLAVSANVVAPLSPDPPKVEAITEKLIGSELPPNFSSRPLLWSIALDSNPDAPLPRAAEDSVPATLRNLRKCEACGFPVSPGRTFCVECEEKKWRGQLKPSRQTNTGSGTAAAAAAPARAHEGATLAVATGRSSETPKQAPKPPEPATHVQKSGAPQLSTQATARSQVSVSEPELVLTAAMQPSQSFVSAHKFVILALLAAGAGAAFLLLR